MGLRSTSPKSEHYCFFSIRSGFLVSGFLWSEKSVFFLQNNSGNTELSVSPATRIWCVFLSAVIPITRTYIKNLLRTKVRYFSVVSESVVICQLTLKMAEEIHFENRRISNFKCLVTLTFILDRVTRHTVVHHSSTSTYVPNFIGIGKTFCGRTDGLMYGRTFDQCYYVDSSEST